MAAVYGGNATEVEKRSAVGKGNFRSFANGLYPAGYQSPVIVGQIIYDRDAVDRNIAPIPGGKTAVIKKLHACVVGAGAEGESAANGLDRPVVGAEACYLNVEIVLAAGLDLAVVFEAAQRQRAGARQRRLRVGNRQRVRRLIAGRGDGVLAGQVDDGVQL